MDQFVVRHEILKLQGSGISFNLDECPDQIDSACANWSPNLCNHFVEGETYQIAFLCPYLCGICTVEEKCPGADDACVNGGEFNLATCSCDCPTHFSGDLCQELSECIKCSPHAIVSWSILKNF